jgi:hypothetical protein
LDWKRAWWGDGLACQTLYRLNLHGCDGGIPFTAGHANEAGHCIVKKLLYLRRINNSLSAVN